MIIVKTKIDNCLNTSASAWPGLVMSWSWTARDGGRREGRVSPQSKANWYCLIIDIIAINYDCQKLLALIFIQLILNRTKYDLLGARAGLQRHEHCEGAVELLFSLYHKISLFCGEVVVVVVCCALYEENKSRHVSNIGLQQSLKIHHSGLLLFVVYR